MLPVLFRIGATPIWSHSFFTAIGMLVAIVMSWRIARHLRRDSIELVWIICGGLTGAALMARYGLVLKYLLVSSSPSIAGFMRYGGASLLGGLAGAYLGVVIVKRLIGYRRHTGDLLVPGVALGIAIGRVGCHLAERPGTPTTLPWGVHVPMPIAATVPECPACLTGAAMHPSFVYESLFLVAAAAWLYPRAMRITPMPSWMREGDLFKLFLLAYACARFVLEYVRGNPTMLASLSGSQLTVLVAIVPLSIHLARRAANARVAASPA